MPTVSHNLRLAGFKAHLAARGVRLKNSGKEYDALVAIEPDVDYFGNGNTQTRSEIHVLRQDIGDTLPAADGYFEDEENDLKHTITDAPNWQTDPLVVRFKCRVEAL